MKNQKIRSMKVHEQSGYNYKARTNLKIHMKDLRMRLSLVRLLITEPHSKR